MVIHTDPQEALPNNLRQNLFTVNEMLEFQILVFNTMLLLYFKILGTLTKMCSF